MEHRVVILETQMGERVRVDKDHETRIRSLEVVRWRWGGVLAGISVAGGIVGTLVANFLWKAMGS